MSKPIREPRLQSNKLYGGNPELSGLLYPPSATTDNKKKEILGKAYNNNEITRPIYIDLLSVLIK